MSYDGLKEEILVANLFAKLGYFSRFHIQIYPEEGETGQISDIDVFAIKYDDLLLQTKNIIETKRSSDKVSAIFQLYGFREYFEDSNAFFINKKSSDRNLKIANKLNIKIYSYALFNNLTKSDQTYKTIELSYEDGKNLINYLNSIKQIDKALFWNYHYLWIEKNPFRKFNDIQELFKITEDLYDKFSSEEAFLWFRRELFLLAFLSVMEIAAKCIALDNYQIIRFIEDQYYNLGTSKQRKLEIKSAIDFLLTKLNENSEDEIKLELDLIPPWIHILTKIVKILIKNAKYSNAYLLVNENVYKSYLIGNPKNISIYAYNELENKIISSINKDLLKILHKEHIKTDFNHFL